MNEQMGVVFSEEHRDFRVMDLFLPEADRANGACVLFIHGGGWSGGERAAWHAVAQRLCGLGYVTASTDYRLAPQWKYPAAVEDVRLAMGWLRARAEQYGFAPDRMAALGSSAGGHLAAMLATIRPEDDLGVTPELPLRDTVPNAVVCYCPVLDVAGWGKTHPDAVEAFLGKPPDEDPQLCAQASPTERVTGQEPYVLFVHGSADETVPISQCMEMGKRLGEAGAQADLVVLSDVGHGFGYGVETPAQREALRRVEPFLKNVLGTGT